MSYDVTLLVGYGEDPFYYEMDEEDLGNHSIEEAGADLGLSAELVEELLVWDEEFQRTRDPVDGRRSTFASAVAEHSWVERGRGLATRVRRESSVITRLEYRGFGGVAPGACVF
ncbi:hypothetical protein FHR81_004206 [Actinoalloteichus hoggarensis]|uniref:Uncharacterized protein n=1 Tax=Actinoalloteichus hoggarensis TaxID=1470176 RepID=A0A221WAW8_9PSEU|nr:hypothetical protein [Actinoalloteichus hoggarensis]ASO22437.1 hypothetical protein AHOG_24155 [Actinoalloteichus hoggarensis]MBB5923139.1 hypothetical protein [Actinoalloteichus hoggarensis]